MVIGNYFLVACGRPPTGTWFSDTHELNFTDAPASWSWTNKNPLSYQVMGLGVTGLIARASYHWQGWGVTGSTIGTTTPFGGNSESAADFITGNSGGNVKIQDGSWTIKPARVWSGTAWAAKPVKVWNGTAWIETSY